MVVYVLTRKGTLHKVVQTSGGIASLEADNLDDAKGAVHFQDWDVARRAAKNFCRRCLPGGGP